MSSASSLTQVLENLRLGEYSQAPTKSTAEASSTPKVIISAPTSGPPPHNVPIISTTSSNIFHLFSGRSKYLRPLYSQRSRRRLFPAITNLLLKRQAAYNPIITLDLDESILRHSGICDPIVLDPYPLVLFDPKDGVHIEFLEHEGAPRSVMKGNGKGFEAILLVREEDEEYSSVESSWGFFKMRRVWSDQETAGQELFACYLDLSKRYQEWLGRIGLEANPGYVERKRDQAEGEDEDEGIEDEYECFFWAIRYRE